MSAGWWYLLDVMMLTYTAYWAVTHVPPLPCINYQAYC